MALRKHTLRNPANSGALMAVAALLLALSLLCGLLLLPAAAHAVTTNPLVEVRIETPQGNIWNGQVGAAGCTITDSGGVDHTLAGPKAACALKAAATAGGFSYSFADYGWGLYLTEAGGVSSDASNYWLYRVNYISPPVGLADYDLADGDQLLLAFGPWPDVPLGVATSSASVEVGEQFTISSDYYDDAQGVFLPLADARVYLGSAVLQTDAQGQLTTSLDTSGSYPLYVEKDGYVRSAVSEVVVLKPIPAQAQLLQAAEAALVSLRNLQASDGSIDNAGVSAWAAVAFGAADIDSASVAGQGTSLVDFLQGYVPAPGGRATDFARQILAALAAGEDPRSFGTDLIGGLKAFHQNSQVGDTGLINDDIFAMLALLGAGEGDDDPVVQDALIFVLANQNPDGGFGYAVGGASDVDTTAAAIQALVLARDSGFATLAGIDAVLLDSRAYLASAQNADGGFPYSPGGLFGSSNSASTAWVVQALAALGEDATAWRTADGSTPQSYLLESQLPDGSFSWTGGGPGQGLMTAYAVPALLGRAWPVIYQKPGCSGMVPPLSLSVEDVRWDSMADYQARLLTVDFSLLNADGGPIAQNVQVTASVNTNGVLTTTTLPHSLGDIGAGATAPFSLQYLVQEGVGGYQVKLNASAEDGCGNFFQYPQTWPGA